MRTTRMTRDCPFHLDGHRLVGGVVGDHQGLEHPTISRPVEHEVHRPDLIGTAGPQQRLPLAHRDLLALPAPHLQLGFLIQPLHTLVVHQHSRLPELEVDHPDTVALVSLRQGLDALT